MIRDLENPENGLTFGVSTLLLKKVDGVFSTFYGNQYSGLSESNKVALLTTGFKQGPDRIRQSFLGRQLTEGRLDPQLSNPADGDGGPAALLNYPLIKNILQRPQDVQSATPLPRPNIPGPADAVRHDSWLAPLLNSTPLTPNVSGPFSSRGFSNTPFFQGQRPNPLYPTDAFRPQAPLPTPTMPAPLPPQSAPPTPPSSPALNAPHWLDAFAPRLDWLPSLSRRADSSDTSRPAAASSAGDWLGLQRSDFGAFKKSPQGNLGKRSDLGPDGGGRFNPPVTNPLIGMGLLRNPLDASQASVPAQVAPAALSPQPAAPSSAPSPEPGAPHWLDALASPPLSPSQLDAPPWPDQEVIGKGLRRLLGFPE